MRGTGQEARLFWEVLSRHGALALRVLDTATPGRTTALLPGSGSSAACTSGAHLLATAGQLALSAAVLSEVRQVKRLVLETQRRLEDVHRKIDILLRRTERIDIGVAENNLRHALKYIVERATADGDVDLDELARAYDELDRFTDSVEDFALVGAPGLRLSADVRDSLETIWGLFAGLRTVATYEKIVRQGPDPRTEPLDPASTYYELTASVPDAALMLICARNGAATFAGRVASGEDVRGVRSAFRDFAEGWSSSTTTAEAAFDAAFSRLLEDFDDARLASVVPGAMDVVVGFWDHLDERDEDLADLSAARDLLTEYVRNWWQRTDAGLVARALVEIGAYQEHTRPLLGPAVGKQFELPLTSSSSLLDGDLPST